MRRRKDDRRVTGVIECVRVACQTHPMIAECHSKLAVFSKRTVPRFPGFYEAPDEAELVRKIGQNSATELRSEVLEPLVLNRLSQLQYLSLDFGLLPIPFIRVLPLASAVRPRVGGEVV